MPVNNNLSFIGMTPLSTSSSTKQRAVVWATVHTCAPVLSTDENIIRSHDYISVPCLPSRDSVVTGNK